MRKISVASDAELLAATLRQSTLWHHRVEIDSAFGNRSWFWVSRDRNAER
jgi:hypothetical protein